MSTAFFYDLIMTKMTRQLNPTVFGELNQNLMPEVSSSAQTNLSFYDDPFPTEEALERLKLEFEKVKFAIQDNQKTGTLRIDKVLQKMHLFEERLNMIQKETHEKWSDLSIKLRDRNSSESKVESLIERHNQIVQSFELRISQAQKLIDNQTTQLAKQQLLIDEARRQIEKLKKL